MKDENFCPIPVGHSVLGIAYESLSGFYNAGPGWQGAGEEGPRELRHVRERQPSYYNLNIASSPERSRTASGATTCCWRCSRPRWQTGGSEIRCIGALPVVFIMSKTLPLILWNTLS